MEKVNISFIKNSTPHLITEIHQPPNYCYRYYYYFLHLQRPNQIIWTKHIRKIMNKKVASANKRSKNNPNKCAWAFVSMSDSGKVCCGILLKNVKKKVCFLSWYNTKYYTCWSLIKIGIVMLKNSWCLLVASGIVFS